MGQTLAEKILSEKCGRKVKAGDIVIVPVDWVMAQDGTAPLAIESWRSLFLNCISKPENTIFFLDHSSPAPRKELAVNHKQLRKFAQDYGIIISDIGRGICHQVLAESYVRSGDVVIGADSHTCTLGAIGAFATGMGSTDIAVGMSLGKTWMRVPTTVKVEVNGRFPEGVSAKDLILEVIGMLSSEGATYKSLEFTGELICGLSMSERLTICNMAVEAGAKTGIVPPDEVTAEYLSMMGRADSYTKIEPDRDAEYERKITINGEVLKPKVSVPHRVDNVMDVEELKGVKIDEVFIGTCTNGRLEDFRAVCSIVKGKRCAPGVRLIVGAASKRIYRKR